MGMEVEDEEEASSLKHHCLIAVVLPVHLMRF